MRGIGESEHIRAVVTDGQLTSVTLNPRSLLLTPEKLAVHVLVAVNAALDDFFARSAGPDPLPAIDPLAVARQMRELRDEIGVRMRAITNSMQASADKLRQEAEVASDVPTLDLRHAFDQVADLLETIGDVPDGEAGVPLGEGFAARGMVRATCRAGPRLTAVMIDQRSMRTTPELSGYLVKALNHAMDEFAAKLREHRRAAGADPDLIEARIHELQESGIAQMRSFGERLSSFMESVRPHE